MVAGAQANWTGPKQFAYVRYDPDVTQQGLDALGLSGVKAENVQLMDSVKYIPEIQQVGKAYAATHVRPEQLAGFI
jgi:hypothetical protein